MDSSARERRQSAVVLIPALNEQETIGPIVTAALAVPEIKQVVVVDNGSRDETAARASQAGATVVEHRERGKGQAVRGGLGYICASPLKEGLDTIVLLDADLRELHERHFRALIEPMLDKEIDMVCGVLWKPSVFRVLGKAPVHVLTGQRAIRFDALRSVDLSRCNGYELEATLNCAIDPKRTTKVSLSGVKHVRREDKLYSDWAPTPSLPTYITGPWTRLRMLASYAELLAKSHRLPKIQGGDSKAATDARFN
jgi:glycosyltransferase involved in cell wall biosynthesis